MKIIVIMFMVIIGMAYCILNQNEKYKNAKEKSKKVKEELKKLTNEKNELEHSIKISEKKLNLMSDLENLKTNVERERKRLDLIRIDISKETNRLNLINKVDTLKQTISKLEDNIEKLENEEYVLDTGVYKCKYNLSDSSLYKAKINRIKEQQKQMVKDNKAVICTTEWTINGNKKEGARQTKDNIKLVLKAFNFECDTIISKVKYNNVEGSRKKITKCADSINKCTERNAISITQEYILLKIEELYLKYEYECKLQEEKEEQKAIRERMKEEERVLKEIEKAKEKVNKEEEHFKTEIAKLKEQLKTMQGKQEEKTLDKIQAYERRLEELDEQKKDVLNREKNTRAGYVYVISNVGSFGENIYKIGMTRRLDPMDRVNELSNASVPFKFDVHAMIFSEDAPTLESNLHKYFKDRQVNKVNYRKEFFNVSLKEIEQVVKKEFDGVVEFTKVAKAEEYRKTLMINEENRGISA